MAQHSAAIPDTHGSHVNDAGHPTELDYIKMGGMLILATLIEIFCWFTIDSHEVLIPILVVLSIAKFVTQVGYFMHLKFDGPMFRYMFGFGLMIAAAQNGTPGPMIGLDLFVVAVIYAFWLIKQHFDRIDRLR